jgi:endonuclease/exonuclease/phosphatase family metal-dependent hydrolase
MSKERRLLLTLSLGLLFWFYLQGIRVLLSRMFGVVYDALFVGPFSVFAVLILISMFLSFVVPPILAETSFHKALWLPSVALLALIRIAMTVEDPTWRLYSGIAAVFFGTLVLALAWRLVPKLVPLSMTLALLVGQLARAFGNTLDPTLLSRWLPIQVALSLAAIALLVVAKDVSDGDMGLSPLGALSMGGFIFLQVSLLDFPNALSRWSGVDYTWVAPLLMFATVLVAWQLPVEVGEVVLWRIFPGRMLMVIIPLLGIALGGIYTGPFSLFGLLIAQIWVVWMLRYSLGRWKRSGVWLSIGMLLFLILSFAYAFAFTYPYTLAFFKGKGLAIVLIATFLATLAPFGWPIQVPSPSLGMKAEVWALSAILLIGPTAWLARPVPVKYSSRTSLRMGTYNIHYGYNAPWRFNLPAIADTIAKSGADVVALQEVDTGRPTSYMVDDALYLGRKLGMEVLYLPTIEHLTGIALLSRFPVSDIRGTLLTSHLEQTGIVGARVKLGGVDVHVYGIWLGLSRDERMRQITEATRFIDEIPGAAALGGDFNSTPDSPVYSHMKADGFLDPFASLGRPNVLTDPAIAPKERIDYVWLRGFVLTDAQVLDSVASDHRMVAVEGKPK